MSVGGIHWTWFLVAAAGAILALAFYKYKRGGKAKGKGSPPIDERMRRFGGRNKRKERDEESDIDAGQEQGERTPPDPGAAVRDYGLGARVVTLEGMMASMKEELNRTSAVVDALIDESEPDQQRKTFYSLAQRELIKKLKSGELLLQIQPTDDGEMNIFGIKCKPIFVPKDASTKPAGAET